MGTNLRSTQSIGSRGANARIGLLRPEYGHREASTQSLPRVGPGLGSSGQGAGGGGTGRCPDLSRPTRAFLHLTAPSTSKSLRSRWPCASCRSIYPQFLPIGRRSRREAPTKDTSSRPLARPCVGCLTDDVCEPGETRGCQCGPRIGSQVCESDGQGWGGCRCEPAADNLDLGLAMPDATDVSEEPDAHLGDSGPSDVEAPDLAPVDSGTSDAGMPEAGMPDAGPVPFAGHGRFVWSDSLRSFGPDFMQGLYHAGADPQCRSPQWESLDPEKAKCPNSPCGFRAGEGLLPLERS